MPIEQGYTSAPIGTAPRLTGARPSARHALCGATPHRITGPTPTSWIRIPRTLSYWLNNQYGICVTAEEAFAKACSGILISDQVCGRWAEEHGVLNGAMLDEVLDWMAQKGFSQDGNTYNDGGKSSIDYANAAVLQNAIYNGPVKIGVASGQLQNVVGGKNGWFGIGFRNDQDIDHAVCLCGYGKASEIAQWLGVSVPHSVDPNMAGYALFTWDTIGFIDTHSMVAITGEAWLRTPTTITQGANPPSPDVVFTPDPTPPEPPGPTGNVLVIKTTLNPGTYKISPGM